MMGIISSARPSSRAFAVPAKVRQSTFRAPFSTCAPRSIRSAQSSRRASSRAKNPAFAPSPAFLEALIEAVPYKIPTVLTDNGVQFAFQPRHRDGPTARYGTHMFNVRCREHGIEHRLTKRNRPWTNGQVERMNRTIKDATVRRYYYDSHNLLRTHLTDFLLDAYSFAKRLRTFKELTPYEYNCKLWTIQPKRPCYS